MQNYYLAIDIGASSGRHILAHLKDGKMVTEEIHRFPNGATEKNGTLCWDIDGLFKEIKKGIKKCREIGKIPVSVGIDTWGVDFVLLDKEHCLVGDAVAYRDGRTLGMDDKVYQQISEEELYQRTGIQKQIYNSIYQLMAVKEQHPEYLEAAETMLLMPDYLHYLLTGRAAAEYTIATTSQLVNIESRDWDEELMERLGFPRRLFPDIVHPGSRLGSFTEEVKQEVGYDCQVVLPASHDTGSAVIAVPSNQKDVLYISSGTWSLLGTELAEADNSPVSKKCNFTNEGGYGNTFRYLKNIMGLWMIQSVKREIGGELSFGEICEQASHETISSIVNCNDDRFLAPSDMMKEVQAACRESGQSVPEGIAQVAAVIYNSLARCYADAIQDLENITGKHFEQIHIVGGGANADYLNQLTAQAAKREVFAGPVEATAIGNLAAQMIASRELEDLTEARNCIYKSFSISKYKTTGEKEEEQ